MTNRTTPISRRPCLPAAMSAGNARTAPHRGSPPQHHLREVDLPREGREHAHHAERLAEVLAACDERPCSAAEVLPVLFKRALDLHQTTFAMGESIAHLHLLWHDGRLQRHVSGDGIYRFSSRTATAAAGPADQAHDT